MFALINVLCLGIGIVFCLLIGIYIKTKKSFNDQLDHVDRQCILKSDWKDPNTASPSTTIGPLAKALKDQYPHLVANYYRNFDITAVLKVKGDIHREKIALADTSLISMYGFHVLKGAGRHPFRDNHSAVMTASMAQSLFGTEDVLNLPIQIETIHNRNETFIISAVLYDLAPNSITTAGNAVQELFIPIAMDSLFMASDPPNDWSNVFVSSYIKLKPGINVQQIREASERLIRQHGSAFIKTNLRVSAEPVKSYYLNENDGSIRKMIFALSIVAGFILLMAMINFVNLSVGLSMYRLKEIGLRKIFGTSRLQLILQHLTESLLFTISSSIFAIVLYEVLRPMSGNLLGISYPAFYNLDALTLLAFIIFTLIIGVISGLYPALVLSFTNAVIAVKGKLTENRSVVTVRKLFFTIQLTVAVAVFITTLIMSQQIRYVFSKDLGYAKDQVLVISSLPAQQDSVAAVKIENACYQLSQVPGVRAAAVSSKIPDGRPEGSATLQPEFEPGKKVNCPIISADPNFARVYGLRMEEGKFMSKNPEPGEVVLNEAALRAFGWKNAIGKRFNQVAGVRLKVTGVVHDFNIASLHNEIEPLLIMNLKDINEFNYISLKLATKNMTGTIAALRDRWKSFYADLPFEYFFMNQKFQEIYQTDEQLQKASTIATALNLTIVFLGLIGIVSLAVVKRIREIAVRKVLGADTRNILRLFSKEYSIYVVPATICGCPLAYFASSSWLQTYSYRISQSAFPFLLVTATMFLLVIGTVSVQCLKYAVAKPIDGLRNE